MPSRRYIICSLPIAHINGKMANTATIVHNNTDSSDSDISFYYGYRHNSNPFKSLFGYRQRARNLANNPYTDAEISWRLIFRKSVLAVNNAFTIPAIVDKVVEDFKKQNRYRTPRAFAMAETLYNGGDFPSKWLDS